MLQNAPRRPGSRPGRAAEINTGMEHPVHTISAEKSQALARLCRQRVVERICQLPRLVGELLAEIGRHHGSDDDIDRRLDWSAGLDHDLLAALGADRFPASPVRCVGGVR